jgi:LexA-binding, inner membrane-associated putative hydrolase
MVYVQLACGSRIGLIYLSMHTYSHAVFTWAVARYVQREESHAAVWGAVGSSLPDVPTLAKAAYVLWRHRNSITKDEFLEALEYFEAPSGKLDLSVHSLAPVGALLALYKVLRLKDKDPKRVLLAFLLGWAGHNLMDFPTHADDARPPFWPLLRWRWKSPISYWDRKRYALPLLLTEHGAILMLVLAFLHQSYRDTRGVEAVETDVRGASATG